MRYPAFVPLARPTCWSVLAAVVSVVLLLGCDRDKPPVLGEVGTFSLVDHNGEAFEPSDVEGQVWITAFMFTRCPTICPRVTRAMREIQKESKERDIDVSLVSFSVDPDNDTPEVLRKYGREYGADLSNWTFATGELAELTRMAERGFKTALVVEPDPDKEHFGITHASHLMLIDDQLRIRGYYSTSDPQALARILDDADTLD